MNWLTRTTHSITRKSISLFVKTIPVAEAYRMTTGPAVDSKNGDVYYSAVTKCFMSYKDGQWIPVNEAVLGDYVLIKLLGANNV